MSRITRRYSWITDTSVPTEFYQLQNTAHSLLSKTNARALNSLVTSNDPDWEGVFHQFHALRKPNADAIADMAVENLTEMRDSVMNPGFLLNKQVGFELEKRWPGKFIPRYSMVVFHPEIPYAEAQRRSVIQDKILDKICAGISAPEQVNWDEAEKLVRQIA